MEETGTYRLGTSLSSSLELMEPSVELGRQGVKFCFALLAKSAQTFKAFSGQGRGMQTRWEPDVSVVHLKNCARTCGALFPPFSRVCSMCSSGTVSSLGKFGFLDCPMVCVVCSVFVILFWWGVLCHGCLL